MPLPKSYKTDESFLEKIAMGAMGTRRTLEDLKNQAHEPIELERGSTSFKIWKAIKIKRTRVPDILCVKCAHRFESRAKTKLEITMSHSSSSHDRAWDYGMKDTDYVALVECKHLSDNPLDWEASKLVQYIQIKDLRDAWKSGLVSHEKPKGFGEGFEIRVTWPSAKVAYNSRIIKIDPHNSLQYQFQNPETGKTQTKTIKLKRKNNCVLEPVFSEGELISEGQIAASVVPISTECPCNGGANESTYISDLTNVSLSVRYAAAKALNRFNSPNVINSLLKRLNDPDEHIFVKVDAAAGLMRHGEKFGSQFLQHHLYDECLEYRLETVMVLSEVRSKEAISMLIKTINDENQHPEIRAGAAWALGETGSKESLRALITSFNSMDLRIKIEAARALAKIGKSQPENIVDLTSAFSNASAGERSGLAWAIARAGGFSLNDFILNDDMDIRQWIAYIFGQQRHDHYLEDIESIKEENQDIYFAVTLLWKIADSWISGLEEF